MCLNPEHAARKHLRSIDTHSWNTQCHFPERCNFYKIFIPWSFVLFEKLTDSQLVRNYPPFAKTEISLSHLQFPASCHYSEPVQFSPCPQSHFQEIHLNIIFPSTPGSTKWPLSIRFPHYIFKAQTYKNEKKLKCSSIQCPPISERALIFGKIPDFPSGPSGKTNMYMSMEHWWNDTDRGKLKYSRKTPYQCYFLHHK